MNEVRVYGGGAVFASISERFGFLFCGLGMFFGMETVNGAGAGWQSLMAILTSSASNSASDDVGEDAVEDVRIDKVELLDFRVTMTLRQNCLYTRRASFLLCSSKPSQEQSCNCCASLAARGTRFGENLVSMGRRGFRILVPTAAASRAVEGARVAGSTRRAGGLWATT